MRLSDVIEDLITILEHRGNLVVTYVAIDVVDKEAEDIVNGEGIVMLCPLIDHLPNKTNEP